MKIIYKSLTVIILVIVFFFLRYISKFTDIVENVYGRYIYKYISSVSSKISSIFPFSLSEIMIPILTFLIIFFIITKHKSIINSFRSSPLSSILNLVFIITVVILTIMIAFTVLWGLNYYRKPLLSYQKEEYSPTQNDLLKLAYILSSEANLLKENIIKENINYTIKEINEKVFNEYKNVFNEYPFLEIKSYKAKPIISSKLFLLFNVSGIFSPFTSEANFNRLVPKVSMPFVVAHEMSHRTGVAYEDEANFLAYLACYNSTNSYINYSASFMGLLYTIGALEKNDEYKKFISSLSEDVLNDIRNYYSFWEKYDKPIARVASKVNDSYLKANNQKDGIRSYSKVIRLLAYYRLENK